MLLSYCAQRREDQQAPLPPAHHLIAVTSAQHALVLTAQRPQANASLILVLLE